MSAVVLRRRRVAAAVLATVVLGAVGAGRTGRDGDAAAVGAADGSGAGPGASAAPAPLRRVLVLGDSVMFDAAPAVMAAFDAAGADVHEAAYGGIGLTVDHDWRSSWGAEVARFRPDLVLVLVGSWDGPRREVDGATLVPGTAPWRAWYDGLLDDAVALLTRDGVRLVWLTAPLDLDPELNHGLRAVNAAVQALPARSPDVAVIDAAALLGGPDGGFAQFLPGDDGRPEQVRKSDGLHLCPAAAERLAAASVEAARRWWPVSPAPGWDAGAWRHAERYRAPRWGPPCA